MTREEAIEILKNPNEMYQGTDGVVGYTFNPNRRNYEAFQLAIKALEQEPCEDARSLAQVFEILGNLMSIPYDLDRPINKDDVSESMDEIRALPPVTPERPKGHWCPQNDDYFDWYECSECGYGSEGEMQYSSEVDVRTNYCPNCGAEMESEE